MNNPQEGEQIQSLESYYDRDRGSVGQCTLSELASEFKTSVPALVKILKEHGVDATRDGDGRITFPFEEACDALSVYHQRSEASGKEYALEFVKASLPQFERMIAELVRKEFHQAIVDRSKTEEALSENLSGIKMLLSDLKAATDYLLRMSSQIDLAATAGLSSTLPSQREKLTEISVSKVKKETDKDIDKPSKTVSVDKMMTSEGNSKRNEIENEIIEFDEPVEVSDDGFGGHYERFVEGCVNSIFKIDPNLAKKVNSIKSNLINFVQGASILSEETLKIFKKLEKLTGVPPRGGHASSRSQIEKASKWIQANKSNIPKDVLILMALISNQGSFELDEIQLYLAI